MKKLNNDFISIEYIRKNLKENKNKQITLMKKANSDYLKLLESEIKITEENEKELKEFFKGLKNTSEVLLKKAITESCSKIEFNIFLYSIFEAMINFKKTNNKMILKNMKTQIANAQKNVLDLLFVYETNSSVVSSEIYKTFKTYLKEGKEENFLFLILTNEQKLDIKNFLLW